MPATNTTREGAMLLYCRKKMLCVLLCTLNIDIDAAPSRPNYAAKSPSVQFFVTSRRRVDGGTARRQLTLAARHSVV